MAGDDERIPKVKVQLSKVQNSLLVPNNKTNVKTRNLTNVCINVLFYFKN